MGRSSKGEITFLKHVTTDLAGRHVVFVDDIIDSGLTLQHVREHLLSRRRPACASAPSWPASACWPKARSSTTWASPSPRASWSATASTTRGVTARLPDICVLKGRDRRLWKKLIAVARGDAPGDLLLANARIVNVFTSGDRGG